MTNETLKKATELNEEIKKLKRLISYLGDAYLGAGSVFISNNLLFEIVPELQVNIRNTLAKKEKELLKL